MGGVELAVRSAAGWAGQAKVPVAEIGLIVCQNDRK